MYYADKRQILENLFGVTPVTVGPDWVQAGSRRYPVVNDVIILLEPVEYPLGLATRLAAGQPGEGSPELAEDIQYTFGEEWRTFPEMLREYAAEFHRYFDLVDLAGLRAFRVCDLGCGMGRWSVFLSPWCRELVLVDFSDAIFAARRHLAHAPHALFFMGDLMRLPFRSDFADFIVCLGVLHHLPVPALEALRRVARYGPRLLVYLYYALDNRPGYYRLVLTAVTQIRRTLSRIRHRGFRRGFTWAVAAGAYWPLVQLGRLLDWAGLGHYVPLYETYTGKSLTRMEQDVYDRFFTGIEQRVSREEILALRDTFARIVVSDQLPYWHFLCER